MALKINGRRYEFSEQIQTNISLEYLNDEASKWNAWEMVRECVQNIMDEAEYQADQNGGHLSEYMEIWSDYKVNQERFWRIWDKGRGVDLEDILFLGISGKRGTHYRGQKGEGQLMAFLVAAREEIGLYMTSQDWAIEPVVVEGKYRTLALNIYKAQKSHPGTRIFIEWNTEADEYLQNAKGYFPDLRKPRKRRTYTPSTRSRKPKVARSPSTRTLFEEKWESPRLFVKGIFVKHIDALFSYNLDLPLNRDRNIVSNDELLPAIESEIGDLKTFSKILRIVKEIAIADNRYLLEGQVRQLDPVNPKQWASALRKACNSRKTVLWTNDIMAIEARLRGYEVVRIDHPVYRMVFSWGGIKHDCDVASVPDPYRECKTLDTKAARRKRFLEKVGDLLKWSIDIKVFAPVKGPHTEIRNGFQEGRICWLRYDHLRDSNLLDVLRTFIHEYGHWESGAMDNTRAFENWAFQLCADLMVADNGKIARAYNKVLTKEKGVE
jgi:hypothetical protein